MPGPGSTTSASTSHLPLARRRKLELADLGQKVEAQRLAVRRKEGELVEFKKQLAEEERQVQVQFKEAGSKEQRVDVGTLKGEIEVKQVGREMAIAIKKRQDRRKASLRERLNKQKTKLDNSIAHNRSLRTEIEERRHVRLHHLEALKIGGTQVMPPPPPPARPRPSGPSLITPSVPVFPFPVPRTHRTHRALRPSAPQPHGAPPLGAGLRRRR